MPARAGRRARGLEVGGVVDDGRRVRRGHLGHVPDLLEEGRQLAVLQLQGDAHVGVLHAQRAQLRQDGQDLAVEHGAARGGALLVQDVHPQRVQVVSLDLLHQVRLLEPRPIWKFYYLYVIFA